MTGSVRILPGPEGALAEPPRSLRERNKRGTRQRLIEISQALFLRQGYNATSLEQIAEEAEVSIRTLLRYFPSKERLALAWYDDAFVEFQLQLDQSSRPTLETWRDFCGHYAWFFSQTRQARQHRQMCETVPSLRLHWLGMLRDYEDLLTDRLQLEQDVDPERDIYCRLIAVALLGGNEAVTRRWVGASDRDLDLEAMVLEVVDIVATTFGFHS